MAGQIVFLDIKIDSQSIGRIVLELFWEKAPKSCANFYKLCVDGVRIGQQTFGYKNNCFHRLIQTFMIQAGDVVYGAGDRTVNKSSEIGRGGCSIYAKETEIEARNEAPEPSASVQCYGDFEDENLGEFPEPFMLAMANMGAPDSNSSQFFITTSSAPHLSHKHSIFGRVIHGKSVVRTVERCKVDSDGFPVEAVVIENCGEWQQSMGIPVFNTSNDTIGGDVYEEFPDDDLNFDKESAEQAFEAASIIKNSGSLLFKQKDFHNAHFKYTKSLRYVNEFIPETDVNKDYNAKFIDLKAKLYLNMTLVQFQVQDYEKASMYATYLLEMSETSQVDKAKAYYRRGNCHYAKKRFDKALDDYKSCKENNPSDEVVDRKILESETRLEEAKEKTKKNIAKFFS
ncbi:LANO_0G16336g1_1 [Lachancea nothofagi CBS 11611]|uniref:peptidylprolyl isomerase n=1 Tax=Lachancea nothofagi CBS 11611 TaxID=1266666 RepID=A0A1G4KKI2_9SACH|nr:LANO_0G16336g1_1 [Lachancea nothofagi CBS 11611]